MTIARPFQILFAGAAFVFVAAVVIGIL